MTLDGGARPQVAYLELARRVARMLEVDDRMHEVDYWHKEVSSDIILCSRGGRCLKIGVFRKAQGHAIAPCVMLHDGREAAPSSTARGHAVPGRTLRRRARTATNTVARRGMSDAFQSRRRVQSSPSVGYCILSV